MSAFKELFGRVRTVTVHIRIDYQLTGDETLLSDELKQALYRIICEACGNAVRHGQCSVY